MWPNIMVAVVLQAQAVGRVHDLQPLVAGHLWGEICRRTRSTRISAPPPGMELRPASIKRRSRSSRLKPVLPGQKKDLRRRKAVDRQAEAPDEVDQLLVITRGKPG